jgi:hypothetical protein
MWESRQGEKVGRRLAAGHDCRHPSPIPLHERLQPAQPLTGLGRKRSFGESGAPTKEPELRTNSPTPPRPLEHQFSLAHQQLVRRRRRRESGPRRV